MAPGKVEARGLRATGGGGAVKKPRHWLRHIYGRLVPCSFSLTQPRSPKRSGLASFPARTTDPFIRGHLWSTQHPQRLRFPLWSEIHLEAFLD